METAPLPTSQPQPDAIPEPPKQVRRVMLAMAVAVDGYLDHSPENWHPALEHSILIPNAGVVVAGTRCSAPLLVREVANIAAAVERDAIIARADLNPMDASFDVLLRAVERPLLGYRLWMRQPMGSAWLVPTGGERTHIRLDPLGLEPSTQPPYTDEVDRHRGLTAGSEFLSVAVAGVL